MKDDNDQNSGTEAATQKATMAAAASSDPRPADRSDRELPELGEMDGEFYFRKRIAAAEGAELPESVHRDNAEEVNLMAVNNGYVPTGDVRVAEQRHTGDSWDVYYAVPARQNVVGDQRDEEQE